MAGGRRPLLRSYGRECLAQQRGAGELQPHLQATGTAFLSEREKSPHKLRNANKGTDRSRRGSVATSDPLTHPADMLASNS